MAVCPCQKGIRLFSLAYNIVFMHDFVQVMVTASNVPASVMSILYGQLVHPCQQFRK